jgi:hypothetical protein
MPSYTLYSGAVANTNDRNLLAISNATGSGKLIKIYRIWCWNHTTAVTGGVSGLLLGRAAAAVTLGTALNFLSHSSAVAAPTATPFTGCSAWVHGGTAITATMGTEFRRVFKPTEEVTASNATWATIGNVWPWSVIWDTGYADSNVEPFVLRENQAFLIRADSSPANAAGSFLFQVELAIV